MWPDPRITSMLLARASLHATVDVMLTSSCDLLTVW